MYTRIARYTLVVCIYLVSTHPQGDRFSMCNDLLGIIGTLPIVKEFKAERERISTILLYQLFPYIVVYAYRILNSVCRRVLGVYRFRY